MNLEQHLSGLAQKTAFDTAGWVRRDPTGAEQNELWDVLKTALHELTSWEDKSCIWATASLKKGHQDEFRPARNKNIFKCNDDPRWRCREAIRALSKKNLILPTTRICLSVLRDGRKLQIHSHLDDESDWKNDGFDTWHIDVRDFTERNSDNKQLDTARKLVLACIDDESFSSLDVREFDELLGMRDFVDSLSMRAPREYGRVVDELKSAIQDKGFSLLYRYVALVTIIHPEWSRITMLPALFPAGHLNFPGGLVLCEPAPTDAKSCFTPQELTSLQSIFSLPYWPWLATARSKDTHSLAPVVSQIVKSSDNDYRNLEHIFGGTEYTLVDGASLAIEEQRPTLGLENYLASLSKRIPEGAELFGYRLLQAESLRPTREFDKEPIPARGYHLLKLVDHGSKLKCRVFDNDTELESFLSEHTVALTPKEEHASQKGAIQLETRDERIQKRLQERNCKLANLDAKLSHTVTVIVPIRLTEERLKNLISVMRSIDSQSLLKRHPENVELVVVVDGYDSSKGGNHKQWETIGQILNGRLKHNSKKYDFKGLTGISRTLVLNNRPDPLGRSDARNVGLRRSTGEIVQFLDDSMVMEPDYLLEAAVRYEHLPSQKFALLGFKERLAGAEPIVNHCVDQLLRRDLRPDPRQDWKAKSSTQESIVSAKKLYGVGDEVNYLELTGDLCFLSGATELGERSLHHFFTTGLSTVLRDEIESAGGFPARFNPSWGLEDTFVGAMLVARGNRLIPCYNMRAFDLSHEKDDEKTGLKSGNENRIRNHDVYDLYMGMRLKEFSKKRFREYADQAISTHDVTTKRFARRVRRQSRR